MAKVTDHRAEVALRPLPEGANVRTWIGFKHFMYLAEQAVTGWFRARGIGPSVLFHEHGVGLSIADCSVQLPAVLDVDDVVDAEVSGGPERFTVRLLSRRPGMPAVLRGRVTVALVKEPEAPRFAPLPEDLAPLVIADIADLSLAGRPGRAAPAAEDVLAPAAPGSFAWSWRVPYYYCQYSHRMQHSGYVRVLEEVVDRHLAECGLGIPAVLRGRGWIPVVSRARVSLLADAAMDETVYTVFTVTDVIKRTCFDARMDCYVRRGGTLVHTAVGQILHAYAIARGEGAGQLAELDDATVAALLPGRQA